MLSKPHSCEIGLMNSEVLPTVISSGVSGSHDVMIIILLYTMDIMDLQSILSFRQIIYVQY